MKDDDVEQIAAYFILTCENLATVKSKTAAIPDDKYVRIRDFTQFLLFNCYDTAMDAPDGMVQATSSEIFWEYLFFFIHLTDRLACSTLSDDARHTIVQELGEFAVMAALQAFHPQDKDSMFEHHMGLLNSAATEYSRFPKIMPAAGEGKKDTLLWEFSKKINRVKGSETNPGTLVGEEMVIIQIAKNLDINSFLKAMNNTKPWWRFWD